MASKPESTLIKSIHRHLPADVYFMKNNNPFTAGVPDVWYSGISGDIWIEYKWLKSKPSKKFKPNLSALQIKWLRERHSEGRNVAVIVGCPEGVVILKNLTWEHDCDFAPIIGRSTAAQWILSETTTCLLSKDLSPLSK